MRGVASCKWVRPILPIVVQASAWLSAAGAQLHAGKRDATEIAEERERGGKLSLTTAPCGMVSGRNRRLAAARPARIA